MKRIVRVSEVEPEEERLARLIFENQTLAKNNQKLKSINKELNKKVKNQKEMLDSLLKKIEAIQRNHAHEKILRDVKSVSPMKMTNDKNDMQIIWLAVAYIFWCLLFDVYKEVKTIRQHAFIETNVPPMKLGWNPARQKDERPHQD